MTADNENIKEVRFDKYCETCRHDFPDGKTNQIYGITTKEEYVPCCYCLENAAREETEVPEYWEEKE